MVAISRSEHSSCEHFFLGLLIAPNHLKVYTHGNRAQFPRSLPSNPTMLLSLWRPIPCLISLFFFPSPTTRSHILALKSPPRSIFTFPVQNPAKNLQS